MSLMSPEISGTCHEAALPLSSLLQDLNRQPFVGTTSPQRTRKHVPVKRVSQRTSTPGKGIPEGALCYTFQMIYLGFSNQNNFYEKEIVLRLRVPPCQIRSRAMPAAEWFFYFETHLVFLGWMCVRLKVTIYFR